MKYIHYDAEGDILSVTFAESKGQTHKGVELSDNIVFYYNPETRKPLGFVLLSYRALLQASTLTPIPLEGLAHAALKVQKIVIPLLQRAKVSSLFQLEEAQGVQTSRLSQVFTPALLQAVA